MKKRAFIKTMMTTLTCVLLSTSVTTACSDDDTPTKKTPTPTTNGASMISDPAKLDMIYSLVDLEGDKGRIYEMTYTVDYKLDDAINFGIDGQAKLTQFVGAYLMDTQKGKSMSLTYDAGCSAFAAPDKSTGNFLMGRNFDFNHWGKDSKRIDIPVIVVHTAPKGGKKSVSFVDGYFVFYKKGFYTDGESDLSMLMAAPYLLLDGINEDGFAISVLKLDGKPTRQTDSSKKTVFTTVAMRMLLDRVSTVKEATDMLKQYNMCMDTDTASYHFFMADATGDYAIVEYTGKDVNIKNPSNMETLWQNDTLRCVTNFYVSPTMLNTEFGGDSHHGRDRYNNLRAGLLKHNYNLTSSQALELLKVVAQGPEGSTSSTGYTQWSEVFNLTKRRLTMNILREWDKTFEFGIEQ
ncbi:MAG: linear amide C-N hydrolase [Prevotellaceae bacterium]|nr:linear amide C-N hydrolase [Prevotellaceae bacterium]